MTCGCPALTSAPRTHFVRHDVSLPFDGVLEEHRPDTVVHLAFVLNPGRHGVAARRVNVDGTANLLDECARIGVRKVVYLSSTTVYGAHPDNPPMLTEESSPKPAVGFQYSTDKLAAERLVREYASGRPGAVATVLRGCPVVGPYADNFIARTFLKRVLVAARGYDPQMQLLYEDDLTEVLAACVARDAPGLYNVAGDGTLSWSEMVRTLGRPLVRVPAHLLRSATALSWALPHAVRFYPGRAGFHHVPVDGQHGEATARARHSDAVHFPAAWQAFAQVHTAAPKEAAGKP